MGASISGSIGGWLKSYGLANIPLRAGSSSAGNAADQDYQAARDAARLNKRVVYVDNRGRAVEAIPVQNDQQTNCRKVTKRQWDNGQLLSETVEEICEGEMTTRAY